MTAPAAEPALARTTARLRAAGCVFAEEEADALVAACTGPADLELRTRRRVAGEPLEHVVGAVRLGGAALSVGPGCFVPRQRTLLLARTAVAALRPSAAPVLVEACAGVAPVAALAARAAPHAEVHAADVDPVPLAHARRNLPPGAGVHAGDLLGALPPGLRGRVDVLAAVPPYVPLSAAHLLTHEARDHEPDRALFGGADGLDVVRALVGAARPWLAPGGRVLVELSPRQWSAAAAHARRAGWRAGRADDDDGATALLVLR